MIDFTGLPVRKKTYSGANGSKISVAYQGELYMLKFPALPTRNPAMKKILVEGKSTPLSDCIPENEVEW